MPEVPRSMRCTSSGLGAVERGIKVSASMRLSLRPRPGRTARARGLVHGTSGLILENDFVCGMLLSQRSTSLSSQYGHRRGQ